MKHLLILCFGFLPLAIFSQKMFQTGEWCAENKQNNAVMPPNGIDGRSDSIDLQQAWITLDLSAAASQQISGNCRWTFTPKLNNADKLRFDLLGLTVDSVVLNDIPVGFNRFGEQLEILLSTVLAAGSANSVVIYYHGKPQKDASGWGGFYFDATYAFNLGVGFAADPHVFGRAWFPCFDNFTERSAYKFDIYTTPVQPAYCNGIMTTDEAAPNGKRHRSWQLDEEIPSYLACVAIGPYTSFKRIYPGETNPVSVEIAALPTDTVKVRNSFLHLPGAIQAFEYWYGPFKWPKLGYTLVPFGSGAMEHATNVAIGRDFIDGTLNYETLWAHEFSHHWWGDLATCSSAEDMWLNEGWASYSEHIFTEWVYGKTAANNAIRSNFLNILQTAHIAEGGYLAVSGIPHNLTYGTHVYNKGAVVAHNLRGYMGDTLFRQGIRAALSATNFKDWSSADFRDKLETSTGLDLHDFFDDWVFAGGYPDYLIDSVNWNPSGSVCSMFVKQKLRGAPHFHHNVPLEFTLVDANGHKTFFRRTVSGENSVVTYDFGSAPSPRPKIWVNTNLHILQARSETEKMLKTTGTSNFAEAKMNLSVVSLAVDSMMFRVEHHFSAPDNTGANPNNYQLSTRFWEVYHDGTDFIDAQGTVTYDGRGQQDQLDVQLFANTSPSEDSLLVLYRPGAGYPWQEWPTYTKLMLTSTTDKFGQMRIQHMRPGQYTIAKGVSTVAAIEPSIALGKVLVTPNPFIDEISVTCTGSFSQAQIINSMGMMMTENSFEKTQSKAFSLHNYPAGAYWLILSGQEGSAVVPLLKS